MLLLALLTVLAADLPSDAKIEFENDSVRIVRVHYTPHMKTALHEHPAAPVVYVYVTDGGRLKIGHEGEEPLVRPPVKAGGIRYQKPVAEEHVVEELDGVESEYIRIELKTQPVDLPPLDIRIAATDMKPYESGMLRIERITCRANAACPVSEHPERPAVLVIGKTARWQEPNARMMLNTGNTAMQQVRVELKTPPAK